MRRQAMSRQQKLIQVAEQIIAMSELLGWSHSVPDDLGVTDYTHSCGSPLAG